MPVTNARQHDTDLLLESQFQKGKNDGAIFFHLDLDALGQYHGHDIWVLGDVEAIKEVRLQEVDGMRVRAE